jgi:hypothetical protein
MTEKKTWHKPELKELPIAETQLGGGVVFDGPSQSFS